MAKVIVAPSLLACDFGNIAAELVRCEAAGADWIHLDIMDGHFVPNLSFGPAVVAAVKKKTRLFCDVHLMVYNPFDWVERFIEAGADQVTFHFEATEDVQDTIDYIHRCGKKAGLSFKPETSESFVPKYLDKCDLVLIMTVEPGFGGQSLLPDQLEKVRFLRKLCIASNMPDFPIQVDGGVNEQTLKQCLDAGANVIVAGTYLFSAADMKTKIQGIRNDFTNKAST